MTDLPEINWRPMKPSDSHNPFVDEIVAYLNRKQSTERSMREDNEQVIRRASTVTHPLPEGVSRLVDVKFFRGSQIVAVDDQQRVWSGEFDDAGVLKWAAVTI